MAAPKSEIELLPQEGWEKGTLGKLLKWALTAGRYIVIVTELAVIMAFLSRFKFDRELTDLHEEIKQKQAVIQSAQSFETEFRFLQKRLEALSALEENRLKTMALLTHLSQILPLDVYLDSLSIDQEAVSLNAQAASEMGLATFISQLKQSTYFKEITLSQVSLNSATAVGIKFQIKSNLAQKHE
ncbi:hypothetical protein COU97_01355 [Candidatus Shapirobacteria bacterium CG10_big_fil_rev_8_21_14_0_10_48_15]|uniref:Fimbrial assembly protein n=1 Tax=Candidatus Shapirobacteria bacterium CG10_big_fil_rev_8_21_14_0_10_48_15 TaxID=1974484 RepID=A0A2M8L7A6_9BACT|nr:MAG: hypothetical protein COU97_01355 [Candidatus Shapirobacteria bacterium CG10_big_fil_rev_8_21_14_0_10_48_15]